MSQHNRKARTTAASKTKKDKDLKLNMAKTYLCGTCSKELIDNAEDKKDESIECTICSNVIGFTETVPPLLLMYSK